MRKEDCVKALETVIGVLLNSKNELEDFKFHVVFDSIELPTCASEGGAVIRLPVDRKTITVEIKLRTDKEEEILK
jgi:hypothetical protein